MNPPKHAPKVGAFMGLAGGWHSIKWFVSLSCNRLLVESSLNESTALISSAFCSQATGEEADNIVCMVTIERPCYKEIKYNKMFILKHDKNMLTLS